MAEVKTGALVLELERRIKKLEDGIRNALARLPPDYPGAQPPSVKDVVAVLVALRDALK